MERTRKTNKIVLGSAETESTVGTDFSLQRVSLPALRNLGTSKCDKAPIDGQSSQNHEGVDLLSLRDEVNQDSELETRILPN